MDAEPVRPPQRRRPRLALVGALVALLACLAGAQDLPLASDSKDQLILEFTGSEYGYTDPDNPDLGVLVVTEGVVLRRGTSRLLADTLILVWRRRGQDGSASPGGMFDNDRIAEVFLDGNVTVEEQGLTVATAESLLLENDTGTITMLEGSWRPVVTGQPLVVKFQLLRQLANETSEVEDLTYTTCTYEHAHWGIDTPWAVLVPTPDGRILKTGPNLGWLGPLHLAPAPGLHLNVDRDRPPLRNLVFGTSNNFGTSIETYWKGDADKTLTDIAREAFGVDTRVEGSWSLELDNYSSRGVFVQPELEWRTASSRGRLLGAYIEDDNKRDTFGSNIEDRTRGRILLQHRTELDDRRTIDIEYDRYSDRGFRREYYEGEFRRAKDPESYINYRDVHEDEVWSVLVRGRANDFETRREYLPQVSRRIVGRQLDLGFLGTGFLSGRDFVDHARLRSADEEEPYLAETGIFVTPGTNPLRSNEVSRIGVRRQVDVPFDVGDDRVVATAAVDLAGFSKHLDDDPSTPVTIEESSASTGRYALIGGVRWARTYSGVGDFQSDTWNFDGVRHIAEPSLSYLNVMEINRRPDDLVQIDEVERLDKTQVFLAGWRHRVQTHQDGEVVTVLNAEVSVPFYPNERRDNPVDDRDPVPVGAGGSGSDPGADPDNIKRTTGDVLVDLIWKPGADLWGLDDTTLRWRAELDPSNGWAYTRSVVTYAYQYDEGKSFFITSARTRPRNSAPETPGVRPPGANTATIGAEWVLSPRWRGAIFLRKDLRLNETERIGVIVRQLAHEWLLDVELTRRRTDPLDPTLDRKDNTRLSLRLSPLIFANPEQSLIDEIGRIRRR